ncbi:MAG TPA: hypothetical protein VGR92_12725 [Steroidobacteraceae bacterium]|nr:hypothetical protein [Steroidobacteraceae bacterium]
MTVVTSPDGRLEISARHVCGAASLRAWLADRWAVLFSHPDDFAQEELEQDRWVTVLSRSFRGCGVAPVALGRSGRDPAQGWLGNLAALYHESAAILDLDSAPGTLADLSAGALRAHIARGGPRFAMILDARARCRRTLSYRLPAELPSPLDLIGWAVSLRKRDRGGEDARATLGPSFPVRCGWARPAHHAVTHAGRG